MKWTSIRVKQILVLLIYTLLLQDATNVFAQKPNYYKQLGEQLFKEKKYEEAYPSLKKNYESTPSETTLFRLSVCAFHLNLMKEARLYLNLLKAESSKLPAEAILYDARVFYAQKEYDQAIKQYKSFLKKVKTSHPLCTKAKDELLQCANGNRWSKYVYNMDVNAVAAINTIHDEENPLISPNFSNKIYFTSDRNGNQDIFQTDFLNSTTLIDAGINTTNAEQNLGFAENGTILLYWQENIAKNSGTKSSSFYIPEQVTAITKDIFLFNDSTVLFSTNQLEGLGGYDIYYVQKNQGIWNTPVNFGNIINTPNDEIHPYLFKDGHTLFFSSNHLLTSIGKYDIFQSQYDDEIEKWNTPKNLGSLINTYYDELNFSLSDDGQTAYFVSNAWDGAGKKDIYRVRFSEKIYPHSVPIFFAAVKKYQQDLLLGQYGKKKNVKGLTYRILLANKPTYDATYIPTSYPFPSILPSTDGSTFDYYVGQFQTFSTTFEWLNEVQQTYTDAQIIPFFNNAPIPVQEISALAATYKDLKEYLRYQQN